ncbi:efflux RND transporter permease subunit [Psychroflexus lacisalsi]|jgi:multidrug efflux pump subunit AcrB|uniref:Efflux RND transporter permease subunit n=1 Tax=Psychroflexus lacisalsi TaxID=503928 RepID=A0ABP3VRA8_9FLAO|nr:efflux RND transporter permease subunit [Psychroflexus lacisalsi]MBZ9620194.1 efflux RND transporter permease subunit [Psychroflexus lacisalsi]
MKNGIAGKLANAFLTSKITILLMVVFMGVGIYATLLIPREEEPQIDVPMADIFVSYPGASPQEIESKVIIPLERIISNIDGIEYVHTNSMQGQAMLIAQFYVGEDIERSYVKLHDEIMRHMDQIPKGVSQPLIKTRSINDVPVVGLTLHSEKHDDFRLKQIADELIMEIEKVENVASTEVIGGRSRELKIYFDHQKAASYNLDILKVTQSIQANNSKFKSGNIQNQDENILITTGKFIETEKDLKQIVVGTYQDQPVYLDQIAKVEDGAEEPKNYVEFGFGAGSAEQTKMPSSYSAVTLSVAKREGSDAMQVADQILAQKERWEKFIIPHDIELEVTRNYGETASAKVSDLLFNLLSAIIAVTLVVMISMGWRGGLVVFISVPVTFALTMLSYYLFDYTLNRITLFALIFITGIVVDDSIIITENMHRHFKMKKRSLRKAAIYAINEVGNPTILAAFIVIASVLPMAFVSGMMGPYMSPMPIGASITMILSLFIALTIVPYLAYHFLKGDGKAESDEEDDEEAIKEADKLGDEKLKETRIYKLYEKIQRPLLESSKKRWLFIGSTFVILIASLLLFLNESVLVKMLPFDNKNEFQIVIDMPEGTTLERTQAVTLEIAEYVKSRDEVVNYQTYVGTASPITFNGLVRHYDLRKDAHLADIQVNITNKSERSAQSHDIAKSFRKDVKAIADRFGAAIKIVEVPPGPPVLSTIVAEVYGPDYEEQIKIAQNVKKILQETQSVVDIDWRVEADQTEVEFMVDTERANLEGVSAQQVAETMHLSLGNASIGMAYRENEREQVSITYYTPNVDKSSIEDLFKLKVRSQQGHMVNIGELVNLVKQPIEKSIYRKNKRRVVYVTAEMAGELESPVYAILGMEEYLKDMHLPEGYSIEELYTDIPVDTDDYSVKWDGEWQITLEVFRDLGIAFLGVIFIIYMLIVGWFQSFRSPIVMMIAIPLSLIGIVLAHWLFDAYFTATSFIGMIALAGIMVRNSVLLIDFIEIRLNEGIAFKQAIVEAGAVRTTPILLTAGTVVIGAVAILFDPIFQGLALSLMGGTIVSTFLTLILVPLVFYMVMKKKYN